MVNMGRTKVVGSAGRFGARYGATLRRRVALIERRMRDKSVRCPYCRTMGSLKRLSFGIWTCRKCHTVFTGGAYVPITILGKTFSRKEERELTRRRSQLAKG